MSDGYPTARKVVIVGAGDHGQVALSVLRASHHTVVGFLDDDVARHGSMVGGVRVLGDHSWIETRSDLAAFVAIGDNRARVRTAEVLRAEGVETVDAFHPSAIVMEGVELGEGVFIGPGTVIVSGTRVGNDVIVNTGSTIDHDSTLLNGCHIAPGVHTGGGVVVGAESLVGIGAALGAGVTLGPSSVVGAGSVVLSDVPGCVIVAGVPARLLRTLDDPVDWTQILRPNYAHRVI